jgi:hypothetical protein
MRGLLHAVNVIEDATGTMTALQFEMIGVDEVAVPLAVMYVDHNPRSFCVRFFPMSVPFSG